MKLHKCTKCGQEKPEELFPASMRKEEINQWRYCKICHTDQSLRSKRKHSKKIGMLRKMADLVKWKNRTNVER